MYDIFGLSENNKKERILWLESSLSGFELKVEKRLPKGWQKHCRKECACYSNSVWYFAPN